MHDQEQQHAENQKKLDNLIKSVENLIKAVEMINKRLDPIWEAFQSWKTLGRWGKTLLWVVGGLLGIWVAIKSIFSK